MTECRGYAICFDKLNVLFHSLPEFREFGQAVLVKEFSKKNAGRHSAGPMLVGLQIWLLVQTVLTLNGIYKKLRWLARQN